VAAEHVSPYPIAVAMGAAMVGFCVLLPWLVHESRRPLRVHVPHPRAARPHTALPSFALCVRAVAASLSPARVRPEPAEAAARWRHAFADQLARVAADTRSEREAAPPAPVVQMTPPRVRSRSSNMPEPRSARAQSTREEREVCHLAQ